MSSSSKMVDELLDFIEKMENKEQARRRDFKDFLDRRLFERAEAIAINDEEKQSIELEKDTDKSTTVFEKWAGGGK